jgi:hypothetical protein
MVEKINFLFFLKYIILHQNILFMRFGFFHLFIILNQNSHFEKCIIH